jgi:YidC/Oxa1 family membrane protein insertase
MSMLDNNNQTGGDKRTLLAVVLSVVVITAGFLLQSVLFPMTPAPATSAHPTAPSGGATPAASAPAEASPAPAASTLAPAGQVNALAVVAASEGAPTEEKKYTISTDLLQATFTNKGGDLISLKLKKHADKEGTVDLIVPKEGSAGGLSLSLGTNGKTPVTDFMNAMLLDEKTIVFSRTFLASVAGKDAPVPITLKKTYTFRDGDYMFGLAVGLENSLNEYIPLDFSGYAYSLSLGPQIGPKLTSPTGGGGNNDYRKFVKYVGGKKKEERPKAGTPLTLKDQPTWVSLSGKYFALIAVPELSSFATTFATSQDPALVQIDTLTLSRPAIKASKQTDAYYFYFGPKTNSELSKYDYADKNAFQKSGLNLEQAADTSGILSWLEWLMKKALNLFYWMIPNYGIAIVLVTVLVKALLFPLTKNGSVASARMQELQPKMQELQAKYKSNPQKLNQEMAQFYKKEGYNPMSGCLPLLIQFPIFIAMYNLFNNHFDLRGAMFIPGWIPDLSQPEALFRFPEINLLIVRVDAIRALPIIYLVSQLLYGKYTQTATPQTGQNGMQMKMMMYWMPIIFFFILYNTPSGLLVYWIISNVISIGQQVVINDILKHRRLALAAAEPASNVVAFNKAASGKKIVPSAKSGKGKKK